MCSCTPILREVAMALGKSSCIGEFFHFVLIKRYSSIRQRITCNYVVSHTVNTGLTLLQFSEFTEAQIKFKDSEFSHVH